MPSFYIAVTLRVILYCMDDFATKHFGEFSKWIGYKLSALIGCNWVGTPNLEIQPRRKAFAADSPEISSKGMASGHFVGLSVYVRQYLQFFEKGSKPINRQCTHNKIRGFLGFRP